MMRDPPILEVTVSVCSTTYDMDTGYGKQGLIDSVMDSVGQNEATVHVTRSKSTANYGF